MRRQSLCLWDFNRASKAEVLPPQPAFERFGTAKYEQVPDHDFLQMYKLHVSPH